MLKAVFLDWYGTLSCSRFFEHWSAPNHPRYVDFQALQRWWFDEASQPFLNGWLTGAHEVQHFIDELHQELGISRDELWAELMASFHHWTLLEPQTQVLIAAVQNHGVKLVLATENVDAWMRWALPALELGQSFDAILSSHELRARKDDFDENGRNRFFSEYLEANGIAPDETVLIDDSIKLQKPLEGFGIRFLHTPHGTGPGNHLRQILKDLDYMPQMLR